MRLLFAGTPEPALPVLEALHASNHEVVAVLTRPDARRGRGRTLHPSPVSAWAQEHGIEVLTPAGLRDEAVHQQIRDLHVDAAPVVAYGNLVPAALLDVPTHGWLNLHFSVLPAWRGAAPVQRAIMAGDATTGASVFRLEEGLDTGPVHAVTTRPIAPTDTAGHLLDALAQEGAQLMVQVLDALEAGTAHAQAQSKDGVSHAAKITPQDARVDFAATSEHIDRQVRGTTPAPGAWTTDHRGARLKLRAVLPISGQESITTLAPGQVAVEKSRVLVGTADGAVALGEVAPAGKSWMDATAWARGARLQDKDRLGQEAGE